MELPEEFDHEFYRLTFEDLRHFEREHLEIHYREFGLREGRHASPGALRERFIELIPTHGPVLEIGPFWQPIIGGEHVRYFDVLDTEGLTRRARDTGGDPSQIPSRIHYVSPQGDLSIVSERFLAAVSSHCIEHQPDLIRHLRDIGNLLVERGRYFLLIPDKRYCFDHFIPESTIASVLDAHFGRHSVHSARSVIEHRALTTHNDSLRHWRNDHTDPGYWSTIISRTQSAIDEIATAKGKYIDVHAWQFTPESFRDIVTKIFELGLSSMWPERVYATPYGRNEFTAVLQKQAS